MVKNWAFIYCSPGFSPEEHTTVIDNGQCKITMVGVDVHRGCVDALCFNLISLIVQTWKISY